jgi:hypothetical protein
VGFLEFRGGWPILAGCEGGAIGNVFGPVVASVSLPGFMRVLRRQARVTVLLEGGVDAACVAILVLACIRLET